MESENFNNSDLKKKKLWLSITNRLNQVEESVSETVAKVEGILYSGLGRWIQWVMDLSHKHEGLNSDPHILEELGGNVYTIVTLLTEMTGDRQIPEDPGE